MRLRTNDDVHVCRVRPDDQTRTGFQNCTAVYTRAEMYQDRI